jgi:hypothetical protein
MENIHTTPLRIAYVVFAILFIRLVIIWILFLNHLILRSLGREIPSLKPYDIYRTDSTAVFSIVLYSCAAVFGVSFLHDQFTYGCAGLGPRGTRTICRDLNDFGLGWAHLLVAMAGMLLFGIITYVIKHKAMESKTQRK